MNNLVLIIGLYLGFSLVEIIFPAERGQSMAGKGRNILYAVILTISGAVLVGVIYALLPFHPRLLAPHGTVFLIGVVLLAVFLNDFIFYWYHRAQHKFTFLWAIHELHHSDTELNVTTSMRTYWIERPLQTLLIALPVQYFVGVDTTSAVVTSIVLTVSLFFTHVNWRLRLGPLTPIICGPQVHRIHHSNLPEHADKNFVQMFPVIDIVFGTYYAPGRDEFPTTGTARLTSDAKLRTVIARPFKMWLQSKDVYDVL